MLKQDGSENFIECDRCGKRIEADEHVYRDDIDKEDLCLKCLCKKFEVDYGDDAANKRASWYEHH